MKILIAEDDPISTTILEDALTEQGYDVTTVPDGLQALSELHRVTFDILITDWMMPLLDGIALIRTVRREIPMVPAIILITSATIPSCRELALDSGADDFVNKPLEPKEVILAIRNCIARRHQTFEQPVLPPLSPKVTPQPKAQPTIQQLPKPQPAPVAPNLKPQLAVKPKKAPPFVAVGISTNTGGVSALNRLFQEMPNNNQAAFLVILQAPVWALDMFAMRLQKMTNLKVTLADEGMTVAGGTIYIARKGRHITVDPDSCAIRLLDAPEENFARPSADILLKSLAEAFAENTVAVVLTGIGQDGVKGSAYVSALGGHVIVQDPATAEAPFLPKTVSDMTFSKQIVPLPKISGVLADTVRQTLNRLPV